ncbi:MAG: LolA-related protein [Stellaceae bacterium]
MTHLISAAALTLAIAAGAPAAALRAEPAATQWDLAQLMRELASVKTASAHFVERRYLHLLKEPLVDSGTLTYRAPDQLSKITLEPQTERLIVDGDLLTIDREGKSRTLRLEDYPEIWAIIESIRGTLAGDRAALEKYYVLKLEGSAASWTLSLVPRDPKIEQLVRSILIFGEGRAIRHILTLEQEGDRSDMTITEDSP